MMTWLRRLLGMGEPTTPPHVQEAMDAGTAADEAFAEVHAAVDDYRRARKYGNRARDRVMADYTAAEQRRRKT